MHFKQFLATLTLLTTCSAAAISTAAYNSSSFYAITGVHTGTNGGERPARRDILDLQKDPISWALYVQALNLFQSEDESKLLSYFQIAGIHGRPWIPWNNALQNPASPANGYCLHNSVLFLTWHRPYLALYEQVLVSYAQSLVQTYDISVRAKYQAAADALRLVYWDWATVPTMPEVIEQPNLTITTGSGPQSVANPFYQYKFKKFPLDPKLFPSDPNVAGDWWLANYNATVRGATSIGGPSNPDLVNSYLAGSDLMKNTWLALVKSTTFDSFGTTATVGNSIEAVHNNIHGMIGLNAGHMSILSYSAFDPIFWLHHANIDRLFAIWEAMNPGNRMTGLPESYGTFVIPAGTMETLSTPLEPFTVTANGPWYDSTPASRSIKKFGYTYPGLNDWNKTVEQQKTDATLLVNNMYNPKNAFSKSKRTPERDNKGSSLPPLERRTQQAREWFVALSVAKFDLKGERFIILFFLGDVPAKATLTDPNCVGFFPVFPPPKPATAATGYPLVVAYSEYSLDDGLGAKGIDCQDVNATKEYLKKNLHWRITKFDGTLVDIKSVPSLNVTVHDEIVTLSTTPSQLPTYGDKTDHIDVTEGQDGGYRCSTSVNT